MGATLPSRRLLPLGCCQTRHPLAAAVRPFLAPAHLPSLSLCPFFQDFKARIRFHAGAVRKRDRRVDAPLLPNGAVAVRIDLALALVAGQAHVPPVAFLRDPCLPEPATRLHVPVVGNAPDARRLHAVLAEDNSCLRAGPALESGAVVPGASPESRVSPLLPEKPVERLVQVLKRDLAAHGRHVRQPGKVQVVGKHPSADFGVLDDHVVRLLAATLEDRRAAMKIGALPSSAGLALLERGVADPSHGCKPMLKPRRLIVGRAKPELVGLESSDRFHFARAFGTCLASALQRTWRAVYTRSTNSETRRVIGNHQKRGVSVCRWHCEAPPVTLLHDGCPYSEGTAKRGAVEFGI